VPDLWTDLLGCLDLRPGAQDSSYNGASQQLEYHRVFGGQLLGQFIRAASLTCPDKVVKSMHTVFAREGRAADPVRYHATRQHQGRSFASLSITAHQPHAVLASSSISMHAVEDGPKTRTAKPFQRCWAKSIGSNSI
jgi:acyl-CoA thioesterase-2